ncbi:hypothetical protein BOC55_35255 [Burkholderia pseudomallei]|nr:hypothetical protein BOC54_36930 [Burkholderia pseudomallei]ARL84190.1 hypothetical protein BOC55_35255 [Burkholderia pseudomallei]
MTRKFQRGDAVWITCGSITVLGTIVLASENNVSLMLGFEAVLEGHIGAMPVFRHQDGIYRSIINDVAVHIERTRAH